MSRRIAILCAALWGCVAPSLRHSESGGSVRCKEAVRELESAALSNGTCSSAADCACLDTRALRAECWYAVSADWKESSDLRALLVEAQRFCGAMKRYCPRHCEPICRENLCVPLMRD